MPLNRSTGNMYKGVFTYNPIKGVCLHNCSYCYMKAIRKRFKHKDKEPYLAEKELTNLGSGKTIFVGSSCDMWAENVDDVYIWTVLNHIKKFPDNIYLFQSKNPERFLDFYHILPDKCHIGTTIETDCFDSRLMGKTPLPKERATALRVVEQRLLEQSILDEKKRFITIEPIMDFDLNNFVNLLSRADPNYVNIGADSGRNCLPEPEPEKIIKLIDLLEEFTEVRLKTNLRRLLPEHKLYVQAPG